MNVFAKNIIDIYGDRGEKWLADLPAITATMAEKYGLNEGMLIIERAIPGSTLKEYFPSRDDKAVRILCSVIKKLHSAKIPEYHNFYKLNDLLKTLDNDLDIPKEILSKARGLRDKLLATSDKTVLLHGDLHHENILQNGTNWLVIDPKGFIGDPVYEVCAFINNPIPELLESHNPIKIINNRILLCAKLLGFPEQRIRSWHYVQTVLCWVWQLEANIASQYFMKLLNTIC